MAVELRRVERGGNVEWVLAVMEGSHNHSASAGPAAHPAHRVASIDPEVRASIIKYRSIGISPTQILVLLQMH